jgi:microcystin-dependent protein
MSQPFVGEIRMFGGNFAPLGWMFCDGALLSIAENDVLFNLIGTTFGGDGQSTFALPDLRGRVPIHQNASHPLGQMGGSETVTLTAGQMPSHRHQLGAAASPASAAAGPAGVLASSAGTQFYGDAALNTPMAAQAIASQGGGQPHENMAPYLGVSFIISLYGVYPTPT